MTLEEAVSTRLEAMAAAKQPAAFTADPDLEEWGRKLDLLQANNPAEFNAAGLDGIRRQVMTYRTRKALHEETR